MRFKYGNTGGLRNERIASVTHSAAFEDIVLLLRNTVHSAAASQNPLLFISRASVRVLTVASRRITASPHEPSAQSNT